jgi:hypothetical protein
MSVKKPASPSKKDVDVIDVKEEQAAPQPSQVAKDVQPDPAGAKSATEARREIMSTKEATNEVIRTMTTSVVEPWMRAMKSWIAESEKFQQTAVDGINKAIDNSHRLAKEGIEMYASLGATFQKQVAAQVERTVDLVHSYRP